jgi:hypothetical protein
MSRIKLHCSERDSPAWNLTRQHIADSFDLAEVGGAPVQLTGTMELRRLSKAIANIYCHSVAYPGDCVGCVESLDTQSPEAGV